MQPRLELLSQELIERILAEAFRLIADPGVKVQAQAAVDLLAGAGARIENGVAHIPEEIARRALDSVPREFSLYNRAGEPVVRYGGDAFHFDPGASSVHVLDPVTLEHRLSQSADLVRLIQVAEMLPQYAAQSTAVVCNEVPNAIGDMYRLFLVLWYSNKPTITGAFSAHGVPVMVDLLAADSGGHEALRRKPRAIFDVCPSPPLTWSDFAAQNIVDVARSGVPAEIISVPLAGAVAPVTLAGTVVQHAAECLSGITIHQLAQPGGPIVWGGAPAIFDMRTGSTAMGAAETAMLNVACAQVGKYLGLPTNGHLLGSDSQGIDAQAGMESALAALMGALGGINMISGAGMLDSLGCHSPEKLAIDAEAIAMAQRVAAGIQPRTESLALEMFAKTGLQGEFLKLQETRRYFRMEQHIPSSVINRSSFRAWKESGSKNTFHRARVRVAELLASYKRPTLSAQVERDLKAVVQEHAKRAGMEQLPGI